MRNRRFVMISATKPSYNYLVFSVPLMVSQNYLIANPRVFSVCGGVFCSAGMPTCGAQDTCGYVGFTRSYMWLCRLHTFMREIGSVCGGVFCSTGMPTCGAQDTCDYVGFTHS